MKAGIVGIESDHQLVYEQIRNHYVIEFENGKSTSLRKRRMVVEMNPSF